MTNPKHTDTSRSGDLVKRLRDDWPEILVEKHWMMDSDAIDKQRAEAADRIEALEAEVERLEALFTNATYEARAMMEEIERLRAELSGWREMAGKAEQ